MIKRKTTHLWRNAEISQTGKSLSLPSKRWKRGLSRSTGNGFIWKQFVENYERFTDLLCAAAKNGCDERLEQHYRELRRWFSTSYYRVSARLHPYITNRLSLSSSQVQPKSLSRGHVGRQVDVLEAIFLTRSLQEILQMDNGKLIHLVSQVSEAVYECDRAFA